MAEFKLDLIGNTEGLTDALKNLKGNLTSLGDEAKRTGKDVEDSLNKASTEKLSRNLKENIVTLVQYETEIKKLRNELKQTFNADVAKGLKAQLDATTQSLINFEQESSKTTQFQKSLKAQLRENKQVLAELEEQGLDTTDTFTQLAIETGRLEDQIGDTNERIKFFASDTRGLDGMIASARLATAAFSVGQGTMALFGAESENVQKALLKVNAAMAILNGLQEIQQALQKSSAATIAIETTLRKIKIFFIGQETTATTALTAAQYAGVIASKALRVALIATGIGAFVALLIYAASKMGAFGDSVEETTKKLEEQREAIKKHYEELNKEADAREKVNNAAKGGINELRRELEVLKARGATAEEIFQKEQQIRDKERDNLNYRLAFIAGNAEQEKEIQEALKDNANESEAAKTAFLKGEADKRVKLTQDEYKRRQDIIDANNANAIAAMQDGKDKELAQLAEQERKELRQGREQGLNLTLIKAKFAKERSDIILKYQDIDRQNAEKQRQFDEKMMFAEDDTNKKILENELKFLDNLEQIKQLELDIELAGGDKSIEETRRIAEAKLNLEIEFAQKRLALLKENNILGENEKQIKELELAILNAKESLDGLAEGENKYLEILGLDEITDEQLAIIKDNINRVTDSIKTILTDGIQNALNANQTLIDQLDAQISDVRDNIDKQKQLQLEGQANTLASEQEKLDALEEQRQAAFEREKQLNRQKLNVDAATQVSALITASANIFKAYSTLPVIGQVLSIAAISAMFAAFALTQIRARQAINQQTLGKGGKIKGERHNASGWGGERFVSDKGNETYLEDGEWVINRKSSSKYDKILEAINADRFNLNTLLSGTGVTLSESKLDKYKHKKQSFENNELKHRIELENEAGNKKIDEFKKSFEKHITKGKTETIYSNGYKIEKRGNRIIKTKLDV